jgi:DUF438 domain-containing protein
MDRQKMDRLKEIIELLHAGGSVEEGRKLFLEHFSDVAAKEIAEAERQMMEKGLKAEEIQRLCDVHASVFEGSVEEIHGKKKSVTTEHGHPAFVFLKENEGLLHLIEHTVLPARQAFAADPSAKSRERLADAVRQLSGLELHYRRKENLLFPYLEAAGITAPPKVMWGVDDEVRDLWKKFPRVLQQGGEAPLALLDELLGKIDGMVTKENTILMPLLVENLDSQAWLTVARDSPEIGFCFNGGIEGAAPSDAVTWYRWHASIGEEPAVRPSGDVTLASGTFTVEELTCMLDSLPCDITFVGKDDRVRYFSEGKERVFPRTRSIIGREVAACHPPKSLHAVETLVQAFKDGKKDSESFWLQRGGKFVLIRYYAVRNGQKEYLGVLEVTEEISSLRALEGEKTL